MVMAPAGSMVHIDDHRRPGGRPLSSAGPALGSFFASPLTPGIPSRKKDKAQAQNGDFPHDNASFFKSILTAPRLAIVPKLIFSEKEGLPEVSLQD